MNRLSESAIEIINELHTERLDYSSKYIPLIDAMNCLSAYENTGMTPEEIDELIHKSYGPLHKRLGKWIDAERNGRLVVLPCKVGDTVYIASCTRGVYESKVRTFFCGNCGYFGDSSPDIRMIRTKSCDIPMADFNKIIFLTREEAEATMREKDDRGVE